MTRRRFTETEVVQTLILQGAEIPCHRCEKRIEPHQKVEREHLLPVAFGGDDHPSNCAYSHKECHAKQTFRKRGPHTTIDSDIHAIAKVKRLQRKIAGTWRKTKRKLPKGRKLQSRPFHKPQSAGG